MAVRNHRRIQTVPESPTEGKTTRRQLSGLTIAVTVGYLVGAVNAALELSNMQTLESSFPPGTRVRIMEIHPYDATHDNPRILGAVGVVGQGGVDPADVEVPGMVGGYIYIDDSLCDYFFAVRVERVGALIGMRYADLTDAEKAGLPIGTQFTDLGPLFNDTPIGACTLCDDLVWRFGDGSGNENWDGYEVISFVPGAE